MDPLTGLRRRLGALRLGKKLQRPRVSIQVWLTALFLFVTALACVTAYSIVTGTIGEILERSAERSFEQAVGNQFEDQTQPGDPSITEQSIARFAANRGVSWGIVRGETGERVRGNLTDFDRGVVTEALAARQSETGLMAIGGNESGDRTLATYASPIEVTGEENAALVFSRVYTESDLNVDTALQRINRLALLAGTLALLISGFSGYVVANLISRRLNRLDGAARRLASGNFDERITTRVEDEVGSLGATFNAMASSLKGAFRQLQQEKTRSQAILDGMTDAVVGVDRDLNATFLNPRARELLENSEPAFHERLQEVLAKSRFSGGPVAEPEVEAGDRIIEVRAAPLEDGALAILRDVTEERQVERAKAEFIANASHELKTPLFALSGYLEMMEDEEDEETRRDFLKAMRGATERLQNLAKTLLDLSRLDANAVTFRLEEVDLEELLHGLKRDFAYTGREIRLHLEGDVPPVRTDPTQLHRMLAILLDNALKYSGGPEGTAPVDVHLRREDGHATVSVRDRGCGIPQTEIRHIFERFYRAQGSSRADGTGLGLALAWEIAQHLGGDICVESEPDVGSTFTVELPLDDGAEGLEERAPQRSNVS
ncbi:sensor histidine kinase [Rubrobacter marinus]|uniref:sensor histidine kinase n=1 Tax=Rubrobacter marinus TaxID=2653852 RepID=UPI001408E00A|nr:ATP-binding protein [Rubrobacter marinus]